MKGFRGWLIALVIALVIVAVLLIGLILLQQGMVPTPVRLSAAVPPAPCSAPPARRTS